MSNGKLLRQLIRTGAEGDLDAFRGVARKVIAEERQKQHHLLADDLETILCGRARAPSSPALRRLAEAVPEDRKLCRIERTRERAGKTSYSVPWAVTGLPRARAGPEDLLALVRRRRGIGNRLHIRAGNAPQALAALRNTMLRLVHSLPGSLAAIRAAFAEDRPHGIATAKYGVL